jgi:asparagine synthase
MPSQKSASRRSAPDGSCSADIQLRHLPEARVFGPLPSFQMNLDALNGLRSQLGCSSLSSAPRYEKRYPYLDRDLLEFVYAIPREQLVRPGQRRSLMRRALIGIVPDVILQRKRKAGILDSTRALQATEEALLGKDVSVACLMKSGQKSQITSNVVSSSGETGKISLSGRAVDQGFGVSNLDAEVQYENKGGQLKLKGPLANPIKCCCSDRKAGTRKRVRRVHSRR